jgi:hypothetical protein
MTRKEKPIFFTNDELLMVYSVISTTAKNMPISTPEQLNIASASLKIEHECFKRELSRGVGK